MIPPDALDRLRCPRCGGPISDSDRLVCIAGHPIRMWRGYVDGLGPAPDLATARLFRDFGYEHLAFAELPPDDTVLFRRCFSDVPFDELSDKVGLDAGCGTGRFSRFLAERLGTLVALDGSAAVEAAVRNLRGFANVSVVRGDFRTPPLAAESFDFVCCIGVLHHLEDPEDGFRALVRLVAPGGLLLVFVYSRPGPGTVRAGLVGVSTALRRIAVHLPRPLLRALSVPIAAALYVVVVAPGRFGDRAGVAALSSLPLKLYRTGPAWTLWHGVFDVLNAPLERRYTWPELRVWYERAGMRVESARNDDGWLILARRPT
jgi:SAM-dependent methyltransferase